MDEQPPARRYPPRTVGRIAGLLYLGVAVCTMFAELAVRGRIVVPGDASATAGGIRASATLFRVSILVDLVGAILFLLTAMALYVLLRHVHQMLAASMVVLVAVSVAITCANLLNQYSALVVATRPGAGGAFGDAGSDALVLLFVDAQRNGGLVNTIFYGLWLLPLGWLVIRSGYFQKVLGILLIAGCVGWLVLFLAHFLAPGPGHSIAVVVDTVDGIAELSFVAWLLAVGARDRPVPAPIS